MTSPMSPNRWSGPMSSVSTQPFSSARAFSASTVTGRTLRTSTRRATVTYSGSGRGNTFALHRSHHGDSHDSNCGETVPARRRNLRSVQHHRPIYPCTCSSAQHPNQPTSWPNPSTSTPPVHATGASGKHHRGQHRVRSPRHDRSPTQTYPNAGPSDASIVAPDPKSAPGMAGSACTPTPVAPETLPGRTVRALGHPIPVGRVATGLSGYIRILRCRHIRSA
jgi:hypothetical protein